MKKLLGIVVLGLTILFQTKLYAQEVAEKEIKNNYISNVIYCQKTYGQKRVVAFLSAAASGYNADANSGCNQDIEKRTSYEVFKKSIKSKSFCYRYKGSPALSWNTNSCNASNSNWASLKYDGKNLYYSLEENQIAKKVEKKTTTTKKKVEKKTTTTKKKVEKKTKTGGFVLGVPDSPAWDLTASPERKRAYRQKRVSKWQAMSVAAICIQWDEHWEYPRDRLDMSTALENKGENPLVCRNPGQDQISRAKKETQKAKAAAAAAQAEVNKNRKSKNKSCGYITYININGAEVRKKVCN